MIAIQYCERGSSRELSRKRKRRRRQNSAYWEPRCILGWIELVCRGLVPRKLGSRHLLPDTMYLTGRIWISRRYLSRMALTLATLCLQGYPNVSILLWHIIFSVAAHVQRIYSVANLRWVELGQTTETPKPTDSSQPQKLSLSNIVLSKHPRQEDKVVYLSTSRLPHCLTTAIQSALTLATFFDVPY